MKLLFLLMTGFYSMVFAHLPQVKHTDDQRVYKKANILNKVLVDPNINIHNSKNVELRSTENEKKAIKILKENLDDNREVAASYLQLPLEKQSDGQRVYKKSNFLREVLVDPNVSIHNSKHIEVKVTENKKKALKSALLEDPDDNQEVKVAHSQIPQVKHPHGQRVYDKPRFLSAVSVDLNEKNHNSKHFEEKSTKNKKNALKSALTEDLEVDSALLQLPQVNQADFQGLYETAHFISAVKPVLVDPDDIISKLFEVKSTENEIRALKAVLKEDLDDISDASLVPIYIYNQPLKTDNTVNELREKNEKYSEVNTKIAQINSVVNLFIGAYIPISIQTKSRKVHERSITDILGREGPFYKFLTFFLPSSIETRISGLLYKSPPSNKTQVTTRKSEKTVKEGDNTKSNDTVKNVTNERSGDISGYSQLDNKTKQIVQDLANYINYLETQYSI